MDPDLARHLIRKCDHQRGGFIHFYFNRDWHDPMEYDLVFNTTKISPSAIVDTIVTAVKDPALKESDGTARATIDNIILCKRVETELLRSDKLEYLHFRISSEDGIVSLSGHIHSEEERKEAIEISGRVKGVKRIDDNLQVVSLMTTREKESH
jgi:hypothetical protein